MLCLGALIMAVGGLAGGLDRLHLLGDGGAFHTYFPWSVWTGSLLLLAAGFLWVGFAPGFTRFGVLVAIAHLLQALYVILIVTNRGSSYLPPASVALIRLTALLVFGIRERARLSTASVALLTAVCSLQILKIFLRVLEILPAGDPTGLVLVDTALALALAGAIYLVGLSLLRCEEEWEAESGSEEAMDLEEFNNPEHPWNKR